VRRGQARDMSGRKRVGACGHLETAVFANFYTCGVKGCDGKTRCRKCGSADVKPFVCEGVPPGSLHCVPCGMVWRDPINATQP